MRFLVALIAALGLSTGALAQTVSAPANAVPGGSNTQVQYNNSGAFGGITGATTNGTFVTLTTPVLGVATGTSLAVGGCTIGANAFCVTGATALTPPLPATSGGTGFASYAVGDLLYADTTTSLAKLPDVAGGSVLISGGVGAAPSWSTTVSVGTLVASTSIRSGGTGTGGVQGNFAINSSNGATSGNAVAGIQLQGSAAVTYRTVFNGTSTSTIGSNQSYGGVIVGTQPVNEAGSGTHPLIANVAINNFNITDNTATTTDATTLYIAGPPTGITPTNPATSMWVASGVAKFDLAQTKAYTVATLPTCNAAAQGMRAHVTDATLPTFLATLAGAGAVVTPAFCDGANWVAG